MTVYSQNGWPVVGSDKIASYLVPGTTVKLPVRRGDVATVLIYVARRFHKEVQPLHYCWCWGYAVRAVRGQTNGYSNHASGTAIDLNAPNFPLGTRNMTSRQRLAVAKIVADCRIDGKPVVRAGAFYSTRPDEMHFEIIAGPTLVARLAAKIRAGATGGVVVDKAGTSGLTRVDRVKRVQHNTLGPTSGYGNPPVDGYWGPTTDARAELVRKYGRGGALTDAEKKVIGVLVRTWGSKDALMRRMADSVGIVKAPVGQQQTWNRAMEAAYQQLRTASRGR